MEHAIERSRKASDCSNSTTCSYQGRTSPNDINKTLKESLIEQPSSLKRPLDFNEKYDTSRNLTSLLDTFPLQLYISALDNYCTMNTLQQKQRKLSMDAFSLQASSNPFMEAFTPKMRPPTNNLDLSQLSSLISLASQPKFNLNPFQAQSLNWSMNPLFPLNNAINANFCINNTTNLIVKPRKFSEDNVLTQNNLTPLMARFTPNKLDDLEILAKKVKKF